MMRRTTVDDDEDDLMQGQGSVSASASASASLSLSALSLFATRSTSNLGSDSVISSSVEGSTRGSTPHTPPNPTTHISRGYTTTSPYKYPPLRREEEDEIVLAYHPTLGPIKVSAFQRSPILKIYALTGTPATPTPRTPLLPALALLHPSHHPRSLWTLATHTEKEEEPFVWAIFDSHEHALSALSSLNALSTLSLGVPNTTTTTNMHPPIAEPALESDLYPFSKLRKVDMKAWAARHSPGGVSSGLAEHEHAGSRSRSPSVLSPVSASSSSSPGTYSLGNNTAYSSLQYSPTSTYSSQNTSASTSAYSPQNTSANTYAYPPAALYHHSIYAHQSNYTESQEITTPIPLPMQPQPHTQNQPHPEFEFDPASASASANDFDDHSTPIPPSHAPYTPTPPSHTTYYYSPSETYMPDPSEMNPHTRESRILGVKNLYETRISDLDETTRAGDGLDGIRPGDDTSAEAQKTPHSPHSAALAAAVAPSRSPITGVAGSRSPSTAPSFLSASGASAEFPEAGAGQEGDGALKRQFGTRNQGAWHAGHASESETVRANVNVNVRGGQVYVREGEGEAKAETTRPFENDTHVQGLWNVEDRPKAKEPSILDRDLDVPREEGESNPSPGSGPAPGGPGPGLAPSSSSFSLGASFIREHLFPPHSSNFTSHVARPDLIGGVDVDLVGTKEKTKKIEMPQLPQMLQLGQLGTGGTERESECIEKTEWTATAGVHPKEPTPAETSFSPLPSQKECDRDRRERRLLLLLLPPPPDQSSYLPLADAARPAPDGDRVKTKFTPASTAASSQTSANANANANALAHPNPHGNGNENRIGGSNATGGGGGGGASVGGGYGSLGRFSPMLDRPIQSRGVGEDEGYDDGGRDEMLRGRERAGMNYHVEDAASALQSSALPPSHQTLQQFSQRDLQKQPFFHEQPPHSPSFFHQNQTQHQHQHQQQQHQQVQAQHQQQQHVYPTATYTHSNLGVAPPTAFRHGDWLCNMPGCGAHNFGRNVSCIMCGAERAVSAAAGFGYAPAAGTGRMQSSGGMSMGMGMDGANELDSDYAYALAHGGANAGMGTGANAAGLHHGRHATPNTFSSHSYSLGHPSTHIPVIPRFGGQHYNVGAPPQTRNGDIAMNSTLVQALGGIGQVAAIQEAIKAHQSQMQPQDGRGRLGGANNVGFAGQRHSNNGGRDGMFSMPPQGGQLLIPTTLGNSPPTFLPQGPVVVQPGQGSRFGEARNGDGQGRNPNLMVPGVQHHGVPSMPSQYAQQGHHLQHPLPPHPGMFSPASAALSAAAIPASKMPALLTPSGRKFAAGGRVQNISRDELNPLLMFWPDNEPLPLTSQIRPPAAVLMALGGVQGPPPPILNTGNKGPIDAQPGDWTCGKCDYLNWRRRRVCANCFPHAEGNTEGTKHSTNDVQERVALLASVIFQQQQQVQAQQRQIQSQQATAAAFASPPNDSISHSGNTFAPTSFVPSHVGSGMPLQQQSYAEAPRRNDAMPLSKMDSMSMQLLAQKYGYTVPPPSGLRPAATTNPFDQPLPLNLPPRMTHPSALEGVMSRGFMDLNRNAPSFQPIRADGVSQFDGWPQRLRSSPPSSRSSFSIGSNSSFYKSANEPTPSPLPLLPAFLQEVVGETSESSSSSVHESPSPPSPSSTSSAFGNTYSGDPRLSELVGAGLRRRERSSPASGTPQISNNNIHRTASHSSIWSFGYPGDRKEGIRPV